MSNTFKHQKARKFFTEHKDIDCYVFTADKQMKEAYFEEARTIQDRYGNQRKMRAMLKVKLRRIQRKKGKQIPDE